MQTVTVNQVMEDVGLPQVTVQAPVVEILVR